MSQNIFVVRIILSILLWTVEDRHWSSFTFIWVICVWDCENIATWCPAMLEGRTHSYLLSRLQSLMNAAARLIFSSSRFQHITPLLRQLHWLKAPERIAFKQSVHSLCTSVCTGPHLHTLLTSFVRWQMSRLVSNSIPVHLRHWLSAAPDSLPSVTELSRSPLHMSGTVCQILSLPHLP